jgi:hypothetical protein
MKKGACEKGLVKNRSVVDTLTNEVYQVYQKVYRRFPECQDLE